MRAVVFCLLLLAACDSSYAVSVTQQSSVRAVYGGVELVEGEVIDNPRGLTVDNGIVRVRYGAHALDFRDQGVTRENYEQPFSHVLAARHTDPPEVVGDPSCAGSSCHENGSHWHDAQYPWYGDGTQWSSASGVGDADRARVLRLDAQAIEVVFEWDEVRLDGLRAPESCILGKYPECGPTDRDHEGHPVYVHNLSDQVKGVGSVKFWKTIRIEANSPGYFVSIRSDPPLKWPEQGSRSLKTGYVSSKVVWSCDPSSSQVARHPEAGQHVQFGEIDCVADLTSTPDDPHHTWPFVRFLVTQHPTAFRSLQYSATQLGSPGSAEIVDRMGQDGRPSPWQAFIGAVEYVSPDLALEPTSDVQGLVAGAVPDVWPEY